MISNQPGPLDSAEYRRLRVGETDYLVALVGSGEPVLLVHGFPRARGSRPSGGPPNRVPNARRHRGRGDPTRRRGRGLAPLDDGSPSGDRARRPLHPRGGAAGARRRAGSVPQHELILCSHASTSNRGAELLSTPVQARVAQTRSISSASVSTRRSMSSWADA